jgi:hypothetical protein
MAARKTPSGSENNPAPSGRGLWNTAQVETPEQIEERRSLEEARRIEDAKIEAERVKENAKKEKERIASASARRARILAPLVAYSNSLRTHPLVAIPVSVGVVALLAFLGIQISNIASANPATVAANYIKALRTHNVAEIERLEGAPNASNWLPSEFLNQIELPESTSQNSSWQMLDDKASITYHFKNLKDALTVNLTRTTTFGPLGWEYHWSVSPITTEITFAADKAITQTEQLVFGQSELGGINSDTVKGLLGQTFRAIPGLIQFGAKQNGYFGGSTTATQLITSSVNELTFERSRPDQPTISQASTNADRAVSSQFSDCVDNYCNLLLKNFNDGYFSFDVDAPVFSTYESWSDSYTFTGCEQVIGAKISGNLKATFVYLCTYDINREIDWEYYGTPAGHQSGSMSAATGVSVIISTNVDGTTFTASKIKSRPYGTD